MNTPNYRRGINAPAIFPRSHGTADVSSHRDDVIVAGEFISRKPWKLFPELIASDIIAGV
jgi:hypothetical protein